MKIYALVGYPLGHSFSAAFFNEQFAASGERAVYVNLPLSRIEDLPDFLKCNPLLEGFNVTIPYKERIIPLLDSLSDEAREVGAVNVVKVCSRREDGIPVLRGYNSDVYGFDSLLMETYGDTPLPRRALVFGTGGASKAVVCALRHRGIAVTMVSRHPRGGKCISYADIDCALLREATLVVNTTPVGMHPHVDEMPPLPLDCIGEDNVVIDVIYNPQPTLLLRECRERGARVSGGALMLRRQAEKAYRIWTQNDL